MLEEYDPTKIQDEYARDIMQKALNLLEKAFVQVDKLREENQKLRDELALLKGEQPKPRILPNRSSKKDDPISSEKERNSRVKKRPKAKRKATHAKLTIHQQQKLTLDRTRLPADAEFKGYRRVIVWDVISTPASKKSGITPLLPNKLMRLNYHQVTAVNLDPA
ncbi:hypothetical protein [Candidatus Chlorohelix sp.]|uniref:hypothetical protein n=1 Tax=Candidatus Chlorohelix sp. TaxID=3139201 RepID=UPI00302EA370